MRFAVKKNMYSVEFQIKKKLNIYTVFNVNWRLYYLINTFRRIHHVRVNTVAYICIEIIDRNNNYVLIFVINCL